LIHGKSLADLPWGELERAEIEVLFVPPTIRELDKLKNQTGRPNKIARQLSSDVRALIDAPGRREVLRKFGPILSKRVELRSVTEALNAALRLDHADQALINYALHLKRDGADVLLLTDDTICGTTAQEVGLATRFLPEHWLREPELDESGKEIARLKAENGRLSKAEPEVQLAFRDGAGKPITRLDVSQPRWPALDAAEIESLMTEVRRLCPQATSFERRKSPSTELFGASQESLHQLAKGAAALTRTVYEPATEEEIRRYKSEQYPDWLNAVRKALGSLHAHLAARAPWPAIIAIVDNTGTRPATETLVGIRTRGALHMLNDEPDDREKDDRERDNGKPSDPAELPLPPEPPRGKVKTLDLLARLHGFGADPFAKSLPIAGLTGLARPKPRDSDAFYWRTGKRHWVQVLELECASWRHGQGSVTFPLRVRGDGADEAQGAIELSVQAHNISDPRLIRLPVRIAFEERFTIEEARALVEALGRSAHLHGRL
jgi:enoyl-CoA hydratase/carnithine racemase